MIIIAANRPLVSAKSAETGPPSGKASLFISSVECLQPGDRVVICARKSCRSRRESLPRQAQNLRSAAQERGLVVVDVVEHTGPGWSCHWLQHAAKIAKAHEAVLIAESPNRFVRSDHYHSVTNPTAQASALELEQLKMWTRGVPMYTVLHPDATFEQERSYETRRGPCDNRQRPHPAASKDDVNHCCPRPWNCGPRAKVTVKSRRC